MSDNSKSLQPSSEVNTLDDLIVKYDMGQLLKEARNELDYASSNREFLGQQAISHFFNLEDPDNARN